MQALILAADEDCKLFPLTEYLPAPMLPVVDRPVMAYAVETLARAGCRDIGVSLHRMAGSIEAYFGTGAAWGVQLTYLLQREVIGTAGALRWAAPGLRDTFAVLPGDAIVDVDLSAALDFHRSHGGPATLIVHETTAGCQQRPVAVEHDGRVASLSTETLFRGTRVLADTGAYIFESQVLDWVPPDMPFDCYADLLPGLMASCPVYAYVSEHYWNSLDSAGAFQEAQLAVLGSASSWPGDEPEPGVSHLRHPSVRGRHVAPGIIVGRRAAIHPTVSLSPPVYIGEGSQIGPGVELGPGVVIGSGVIVDEGVTVRHSTVLDRTYVGRLVNLDGRLVAKGLVVDAASGQTLPVVDPFLLGEAAPAPLVGLLSRAAGFAGALLLLLLWFPAIALLTLALLLVSLFTGAPGRVFELRPRVRWRRSGEIGPAAKELYWLVYFRTRREDMRLLPFGRWLEQSQMDRLPSLWNVLRGDLRLVGVKPLDPVEAGRLAEEWQRVCYEQPAGFTGLWFVQSGEIADLEGQVVADAYYAATRTLLEDLRLLLRTPAARAPR